MATTGCSKDSKRYQKKNIRVAVKKSNKSSALTCKQQFHGIIILNKHCD